MISDDHYNVNNMNDDDKYDVYRKWLEETKTEQYNSQPTNAQSLNYLLNEQRLKNSARCEECINKGCSIS